MFTQHRTHFLVVSQSLSPTSSLSAHGPLCHLLSLYISLSFSFALYISPYCMEQSFSSVADGRPALANAIGECTFPLIPSRVGQHIHAQTTATMQTKDGNNNTLCLRSRPFGLAVVPLHRIEKQANIFCVVMVCCIALHVVVCFECSVKAEKRKPFTLYCTLYNVQYSDVGFSSIECS